MSIDERLTRLEHRESITELRAAYCYRIDSRDWDGFADLFTEDAHLDFGPTGTYDGRVAVRDFAENVVGAEHPFLAHMVHNPLIEIDGETATGTWYFEVPCTFRDGSAGWIQGIYHDEYRLVDDEWLFAEIVADFNYFAEYDEGWAEIVADS
ncbi:nuclear transport factor 2 family protein [Natrinema caseinilyticum]|uniref:nuclear transport factor 2 family protein n=1 Tax=Natrinema caseinilyticum TaxID=2961570 RepID=UPI0020C43940|nr:nuclear transport factor 2 family protein [Natrinema caseinilyticum]